MINWQHLTEGSQVQELNDASFQQPILIYKHSTRCSISSMVLNRLERAWEPEAMVELRTYFLDLITYRDISNELADLYGISHESPQVMLISEGQCKHDSSHNGINYLRLKDMLQSIYY